MSDAAKIIRLLEKNTAGGQRPSAVFDDWLDMAEATLDMLPAHLKSAAATGRPAEDSDEARQVWARLNGRYGHAEYFERFAQAFQALLDSTVGPDGEPDYQDLIGEVFMQFGAPSKWAGQFFTPFELARVMAQMAGDGGRLVHERLQAAIAKSPLAQAMMFAGLALEGEEAQRWLVTRIVPACLEHYEPVAVNDPCVGSGVMLLAHASTMPQWMVQAGLVQYYGTDIDPACVKMARINLKLYGLNGWGIQCALALSETDLRALPPPYAEAYTEARQAAADGDQARVTEIADQVRPTQLACCKPARHD